MPVRICWKSRLRQNVKHFAAPPHKRARARLELVLAARSRRKTLPVTQANVLILYRTGIIQRLLAHLYLPPMRTGSLRCTTRPLLQLMEVPSVFGAYCEQALTLLPQIVRALHHCMRHVLRGGRLQSSHFCREARIRSVLPQPLRRRAKTRERSPAYWLEQLYHR